MERVMKTIQGVKWLTAGLLYMAIAMSGTQAQAATASGKATISIVRAPLLSNLQSAQEEILAAKTSHPSQRIQLNVANQSVTASILPADGKKSGSSQEITYDFD